MVHLVCVCVCVCVCVPPPSQPSLSDGGLQTVAC
eukprot:SAG25_NODE_7635_length_469_cov_1.456757_2_plen_33_part_01